MGSVCSSCTDLKAAHQTSDTVPMNHRPESATPNPNQNQNSDWRGVQLDNNINNTNNGFAQMDKILQQPYITNDQTPLMLTNQESAGSGSQHSGQGGYMNQNILSPQHSAGYPTQIQQPVMIAPQMSYGNNSMGPIQQQYAYAVQPPMQHPQSVNNNSFTYPSQMSPMYGQSGGSGPQNYTPHQQYSTRSSGHYPFDQTSSQVSLVKPGYIANVPIANTRSLENEDTPSANGDLTESDNDDDDNIKPPVTSKKKSVQDQNKDKTTERQLSSTRDIIYSDDDENDENDENDDTIDNKDIKIKANTSVGTSKHDADYETGSESGSSGNDDEPETKPDMHSMQSVFEMQQSLQMMQQMDRISGVGIGGGIGSIGGGMNRGGYNPAFHGGMNRGGYNPAFHGGGGGGGGAFRPPQMVQQGSYGMPISQINQPQLIPQGSGNISNQMIPIQQQQINQQQQVQQQPVQSQAQAQSQAQPQGQSQAPETSSIDA